MQSIREAFGQQLIEEAKKDNKIVCLSIDLAGPTKTQKFKNEFPDRFIECGISEANAIGIASGLSEYGFYPFVCSFGSFLSGRYDQIRCSLAYSGAKAVLIGTHPGLAIGRDGVTQMGLEDVNVLRALPSINIYNPGTPNETKDIIQYLCKNKQLAYVRIGRQEAEEFFTRSEQIDFVKKAFSGYKKDPKYKEIVIYTTGCMLKNSMELAKLLFEKTDREVHIYHVSRLKPFRPCNTIGSRSIVLTIEDHSTIGGLATAMCEYLVESKITVESFYPFGIDRIWPEGGKPEDLYQKYGLSIESMFQSVMKLLENR